MIIRGDQKVEKTESSGMHGIGGAESVRHGSEPASGGRVLTTKVGLHIPPGLSYYEWERAGRQLSGIVDSSSWWLGDWLVYGKDHYADRYELVLQAAGLSYQTLRNYSWVARRFEIRRRRSALTFQHHAEVASLPVAEQDRWLDRAENLGWTTKQLRRELRTGRGGDDADGPAAGRRITLPGERLHWWHRAATSSGTELDQWVMATLDRAAEELLRG
jgi:hypothetical protein